MKAIQVLNYYFKTTGYLGVICLSFFVYACSTNGEEGVDYFATDLGVPLAAPFVSTSPGDSVITNQLTPVFSKPQDGAETGENIPSGIIGEVDKRKNGWARVDFEGYGLKIVEEANLDLYDPGSGGPGAPTAGYTYTTNDLTVTFTDQSTDPENNITAYAWAFGDGGTSTDQNPVYTYGAAGSYTVTLTVTDATNLNDSESKTVTVTDGTPPGDYQLVIVGFSNTRQIIAGALPGYDVGDDIEAMRGNAVQHYADPGFFNYAEGVAIVQQQLNNHPNADGIAVMIGHRYADPATRPAGQEGFRHQDTISLLPSIQSGSPRYSELEFMQNVGALLDAEAPGLDHYLIPLHRYETATCSRKLGQNTSLAIELMIEEAVNAGYVDALTLNGETYRLAEARPGDISGDGCHLSATGVGEMWNNPTWGLKYLIDSLR